MAFKFTIKVTGLEKFSNRTGSLKKIIESNELKEYVAKRSIEEINKIAQERLQKSENYIANNKYTITDSGIKIYNDSQTSDGFYYSLIIEYGSGTLREKESIAHTQTYASSGGAYWYVPEAEAPQLSEYSFPRVTNEAGEVFYMVFGQDPKHIYTDAAKMIEKNMRVWVVTYINKELKSI